MVPDISPKYDIKKEAHNFKSITSNDRFKSNILSTLDILQRLHPPCIDFLTLYCDVLIMKNKYKWIRKVQLFYIFSHTSPINLWIPASVSQLVYDAQLCSRVEYLDTYQTVCYKILCRLFNLFSLYWINNVQCCFCTQDTVSGVSFWLVLYIWGFYFILFWGGGLVRAANHRHTCAILLTSALFASVTAANN